MDLTANVQDAAGWIAASYLVQSLVGRKVDQDVVAVLCDGDGGVGRQCKKSGYEVRFGAEEAAAIAAKRKKNSTV